MKRRVLLIGIFIVVVSVFFIAKNINRLERAIKKTEISFSIKEVTLKGDPFCFVTKNKGKLDDYLKGGSVALEKPVSWRGISGKVYYYNLKEKSAVVYYFNISGIPVYTGCVGSEFKKVEEKAQNLYYEMLKDIITKI